MLMLAGRASTSTKQTPRSSVSSHVQPIPSQHTVQYSTHWDYLEMEYADDGALLTLQVFFLPVNLRGRSPR
jgi:hypothetical protein